MRGSIIFEVAPIFFILMALSAKGNSLVKYGLRTYVGICLAVFVIGAASVLVKKIKEKLA